MANRVAHVHILVPDATWRHLPRDNPADLGTGGCSPQDRKRNSLWLHGLSWLPKSLLDWPKGNLYPYKFSSTAEL